MLWNITKAATEFGVSRETIMRGLRTGAIVGKGSKKSPQYTTKQIHTAIAGDLKFEKTREARARADLLELERKQLQEELFNSEHVTETIQKAFGLVRQALLSGKAEIPSRANPNDPKMAMEAWNAWMRRFFPQIREGMNGNGNGEHK